MRKWFFGLVAFGLVLFLPALVPQVQAVEPDEILQDPALEKRARKLSANLRCVVCQNQSIDDSDAPLAKDLRVLLRERLKAGDSDEAAMDYIVARYGEFVLLKPRFGAHTIVLWLSPLLLLLAAGGLLYVRYGRAAAQAAPTAGPSLSAEEEARVRALLEGEEAGGK